MSKEDEELAKLLEEKNKALEQAKQSLVGDESKEVGKFHQSILEAHDSILGMMANDLTNLVKEFDRLGKLALSQAIALQSVVEILIEKKILEPSKLEELYRAKQAKIKEQQLKSSQESPQYTDQEHKSET